MYHLPKILAKKATNNKYTTQSLIQLILNIYDKLDTTKNKKIYNQVKNSLTKINPNQLRKLLLEEQYYINFITEPFANIPIENIRDAAASLEIPLDEKVFIPETQTWTKNPVPVGICYIQAMEQLATDYESIRSTGGYRGTTGQPLKGRSNMGGQSIGNLDIYSLVSYNAKSILKELLTIRSDDRRSKQQVVANIIETGESNCPERVGNATTRELYEIHMIAMGLNPYS